jgi:glycerol dehydrogenase-like iron-containing ADH family enzyme
MIVWPLPRITFRELNSVEEKRPAALLTSEDVWTVLSPQLKLPVLIQAEPQTYNRDLFDYLATNLPAQAKVVYAAGGGAALEAAKLIAAHNQLPLVIVPTALDSSMMLLPHALVADKDGERVRLVEEETGPATEIIVDWEVISSAPAEQRGVGIVDLLTVVTGLLDWRYAAQKGKNTRSQRFVPWAASLVSELAKQAIKSASAIGQGDREALQTLLDLLMTAAQLNNQLGHTRAQQGGEHYLAQILMATTDRSPAYAELVAPCLLFVAALHGQDPAPLRDALNHAGVRLDQVRATDFNLVIDNLSTYLDAYGFPYSVLNDLDRSSDKVATAIEAAGLAIAAETWIKPEDSLSHILVDASEEAPHEDKFQNEPAAQPDNQPADQAAVIETDTQPADAPVDQAIDAGNG